MDFFRRSYNPFNRDQAFTFDSSDPALLDSVLHSTSLDVNKPSLRSRTRSTHTPGTGLRDDFEDTGCCLFDERLFLPSERGYQKVFTENGHPAWFVDALLEELERDRDGRNESSSRKEREDWINDDDGIIFPEDLYSPRLTSSSTTPSSSTSASTVSSERPRHPYAYGPDFYYPQSQSHQQQQPPPLHRTPRPYGPYHNNFAAAEPDLSALPSSRTPFPYSYTARRTAPYAYTAAPPPGPPHLGKRHGTHAHAYGHQPIPTPTPTPTPTPAPAPAPAPPISLDSPLSQPTKRDRFGYSNAYRRTRSDTVPDRDSASLHFPSRPQLSPPLTPPTPPTPLSRYASAATFSAERARCLHGLCAGDGGGGGGLRRTEGLRGGWGYCPVGGEGVGSGGRLKGKGKGREYWPEGLPPLDRRCESLDEEGEGDGSE